MTRLGAIAGVTSKAISDYEKGEYPPSAETLERLALSTRFPPGFFFGPDLHEPTPKTASFRSMSRMTAGQRDAALGAGALAFMLNDWVETRFDLPAPDLLDLRDEDPETAAATLRQHWRLGERPIKNMVHLLESKGVRVYSLAENSVEVDAFSLWHSNTPFLFLNTLKSAEHGRFDAAHELGHLVLHRHCGPHQPNAEKEANAFAAAFLMPRASVLANAPRMATLKQLIQLKKLWIVSVAALAHRLHSLKLLSDWHYRTLCIEMGQLGFRKNEPEGAQRERSQVLAIVFGGLREEGVSKAAVADQLQIDSEELDKLVFGLMLTSLTGGRQSSGRTVSAPPDLRIVK
ncbi:transcriptional regulator (plasmid) [Methylocystis iwaonis]|uniref:Transcriptional regulator n=2 Tax=Methylocystis iwaonis TaxID=2885079 RepID=A0ABN6VQK7_9HYPH|nr:transcriptional regulator [Methylocystis iwaonis]